MTGIRLARVDRVSEVMRSRPARRPRRTIAEVAEVVGAQIHPASGSDAAAASSVIAGVALNTGAVEVGDLYAALPGSRSHGAQWAAAARAAGATAVLTDPAGHRLLDSQQLGLPVLVVPVPRDVLADVSAWLYGHPAQALTLIGITGTQGKTTSTYLAEAAVGTEHAAVVGTIGTRIHGLATASSLTTPEAPALQALFAVMVEEQVDVCAMEVSSHALVQGRVGGFVFDTAVFLNLGRDHLDFHDSLEEYFQAKATLFTPERARRAVINVDDEHGRRLAEQTTLPVTTFSPSGHDADWRVVDRRSGPLGTHTTIVGPDGAGPATPIELTVPLPGDFNVANALAVVAALASVGRDPRQAARRLAQSPGVPGRMERVDVGQAFTAVVDYAHKPDAVEAVLTALRPVTRGRLIVVLGAGGDRDQGKRSVMGALAGDLADVVVVTDDNPRSEDPAVIRAAVVAGARGRAADVVEIGDRRAAIAYAVESAADGDTVVVAGKGHERGQEIAGIVHPFDDRLVLRELIEAAR